MKNSTHFLVKNSLQNSEEDVPWKHPLQVYYYEFFGVYSSVFVYILFCQRSFCVSFAFANEPDK